MSVFVRFDVFPLLLVSVVLFLFGCNSKFRGNESFERSSKESLDLSLLIDTTSVKTIKLETTDQCLISSVKQIFLTDNHLFVLNSTPSEIFMFDKNGKFVRKIGSRGRGAGEYLNIENFYIDECRNEVIVYDSEYCKAFVYGYNGNFMYTISNKNQPFGHIARLNDSLYCLSNGSNFIDIESNPAVLILNQNGELVKTFHPRIEIEKKPNIIPFLQGTTFFAQTKAGKFYIPVGSDTIFHLTVSDEIVSEPVCCLGIKEYFFPSDISQKDYNENEMGYYDPFQGLVVNDKGVFYGVLVCQGRVISVIGSLEKGIEKIGITVGNRNIWPVLAPPQAAYKDYFVGIVDSQLAYGYRNNYFDIEEDANPVVVLFKFMN